jgi:hypothetical protein
MVFWYRIVCVVVLTIYFVATARGYPLFNLLRSNIGAHKGATQFHK